ncbi:MAG: helix-turn-helix domain-containing protein [Anaerolineales bacterium]|nr:helix-turn-helix domain-containing protein [Anaerolineales bacterium]
MNSTIGQQLRQAREERSLTIEQVAQATRIRIHYLEAMEAGRFDSLPSVAQARGFIRSYAGFLGLDAEGLLNALDGGESPTSPDSFAPAPGHAEAALAGEPEQTKQIFARIGGDLRRQRELLGLSLDDVERHTHLRQHYLKALEAGNLDGLPSPVQGRGMLNNYAAFLGLDPEPLLLRFADGLQASLSARQAARQKPRSASARRKPRLPAPLRRLFSADVLIGGALAVFLIIFGVWGAIRIFAISSQQEPTPTAPSIADVLLASPTATSTFTPEPVTPTIPQPTQFLPTLALVTDALSGNLVVSDTQPGVQLNINVRQRAWMQVSVDGEIEFSGRVLPGSAYPFAGESQVEVLTGNGAALQVLYNGIDLGVMGVYGQIVNRIYAPEGILTPTPTITPIPTATQPVIATPTLPAEATAPAIP